MKDVGLEIWLSFMFPLISYQPSGAEIFFQVYLLNFQML